MGGLEGPRAERDGFLDPIRLPFGTILELRGALFEVKETITF